MLSLLSIFYAYWLPFFYFLFIYISQIIRLQLLFNIDHDEFIMEHVAFMMWNSIWGTILIVIIFFYNLTNNLIYHFSRLKILKSTDGVNILSPPYSFYGILFHLINSSLFQLYKKSWIYNCPNLLFLHCWFLFVAYTQHRAPGTRCAWTEHDFAWRIPGKPLKQVKTSGSVVWIRRISTTGSQCREAWGVWWFLRRDFQLW